MTFEVPPRRVVADGAMLTRADKHSPKPIFPSAIIAHTQAGDYLAVNHTCR